MRRFASFPALTVVAVAAVGCASGHRAANRATSTASATSTTQATAPATTAPPTSTFSGPGALQAEATAAAAGDIPDNQVFLVFRDPRAGYSIKYPEGWAQRGAGAVVVFRDKNNIVRIAIAGGRVPTKATVRSELARLNGARIAHAPQPVTLPGGRGLKVSYSTVSAPNPVTGKRVTLVVDRYYLWQGDHGAVIDLGTPVGVDNVDAYRLMSESFRWR